MNYRGKKVAITGINGFIGQALFIELEKQGAYIDILNGDVRDPETFSMLSYEHDYLFHFADPSSQVLFKRQPLYAAEVTLKGFMNAAAACRKNGIKLIYPSTGLLSQSMENEYARCKKVCEDIHLGENLDAIGIRIFATYGPGEGHKRDYASVPYLFARDMVKGRAPLIFGDGEQVRDFIYIDDTVQAILVLAEECNLPIIDVGSGDSISFNDIVRLINEELYYGGHDAYINPDYIPKPNGYVQETGANPTYLRQFYQPKISFYEGMKKVIEALK